MLHGIKRSQSQPKYNIEPLEDNFSVLNCFRLYETENEECRYS